MRVPRIFRRRHRFRPDDPVLAAWPHPRPPKDPRLLSLNVCLAWVSFAQIIAGVSPSSVQAAAAFSFTATVAFASLVIVASVLVIYSAFCKSQYWSWGVECAGCAGFVFVFAMYAMVLVQTITDPYSANGFAWALGFTVGNAWRAAQLIPRLW